MVKITQASPNRAELAHGVEAGNFREICRYDPPGESVDRYIALPFNLSKVWDSWRKLNAVLEKSKIISWPVIDTRDKKLIVIFGAIEHVDITQDQIRDRLSALKARIDIYVDEMRFAILQLPIANWKAPLPLPEKSGKSSKSDGLDSYAEESGSGEGEGIPEDLSREGGRHLKSSSGVTHGNPRTNKESCRSSSQTLEGLLTNWNPGERTFKIKSAGCQKKISYDARQQDAIHSSVIVGNANVVVRVADELSKAGPICKLEKIEGLAPQLKIDLEICPLCHGSGHGPNSD